MRSKEFKRIVKNSNNFIIGRRTERRWDVIKTRKKTQLNVVSLEPSKGNLTATERGKTKNS